MVKLGIENNLTFDVLYQNDGYILLDNFKEFNRNNNEFNDKKYDESLDVRQNNY